MVKKIALMVFKALSYKEVRVAIIEVLRNCANRTDNKLDNAAVDIIESILIKEKVEK